MENTEGKLLNTISDKENKSNSTSNAPTPLMITIPQAKSNEFLDGLSEALQDVGDLRETAELLINDRQKEYSLYKSEVLKKLNSLLDSTTSLQNKLKQSSSYAEYLEERVKNTSLEKDVVMLEDYLQREKLTFHTFIDLSKDKIDKLIGADDLLKNNIVDYTEKIKDTYEEYSNKLDKALNEFGIEILEKYTKNFDALKASSEKLSNDFVRNCKQNTDTVKKASIDFLKQCQTENQNLISSIPKVKDNKVGLKDIFIILLALVSIVSNFIK